MVYYKYKSYSKNSLSIGPLNMPHTIQYRLAIHALSVYTFVISIVDYSIFSVSYYFHFQQCADHSLLMHFWGFQNADHFAEFFRFHNADHFHFQYCTDHSLGTGHEHLSPADSFCIAKSLLLSVM